MDPIENCLKDNNIYFLNSMLHSNIIKKDYKDKYNNSLLHLCILHKNYNMCKYLIENKICNINEENIWNMTPLEHAKYLNNSSNNDNIKKIINLLQNNNAYYKFSFDSEQIIYGNKIEFYDKIKFILNNLSYIFEHYKMIQFYHMTYNDFHLYPFSSCKCNSPSIMKYTSNLIFDKNYLLFQNKQLCIDDYSCQNNLFIYPFCKLQGIQYIYRIPFKKDNIILGYFLIWCSAEENIFFDYNFETIFDIIINEKYFNILSISPSIYKLNITDNLITQYIQKILKTIKTNSINIISIVEVLNFFIKIKNFNLDDDVTFKQIKEVVKFYKKILIPYGNLKNIYKLANSIELKENYEGDSYALTELYKFQINLIDTIKYKPVNTECNLTSFDFYNILGFPLNKKDQELLNYILNSSIHFFDFKIYSTINSIVTKTKNVGKRDENVFGTGCNSISFVFPEEINKGLDYVFSSSYPLIYKYYYIYISITKFIHPFIDGNGRTSRLILSFCLQKIGINKNINRHDKLLSFNEYLKLFKK
jgi:ankyrin repeat protein